MSATSPFEHDALEMTRRLVPTIHARGQTAQLDAVLELVAYSARPRSLTTALDELPRRIAQILKADVSSIYLLEGEDLVMRGNVGFPASALGEVRLAVGEGITGLAVEYMRPMSLDAAPKHANFRHFPSLKEEQFPIFLALPVPGSAGPCGALVLQRKSPPAFDEGEIVLAAALAAPVAAIAARAKLADPMNRSKVRRSTARRLTLSGRPAVSGRSLGVIAPFPRPVSRLVAEGPSPRTEMTKVLDLAIVQTQRLIQGLDTTGDPAAPALLADVATILADARLKERAIELAANGKGIAHGLTQLSAEAMKNAALAGEPFAVERAKRIAEVCEVLALAVAEPRMELPRKAVLIGDQFTLFELMVALRSQPAGVLLSEHAKLELVRPLLGLLKAPSIVDVGGLFRWAEEGEVALVDADHGLVRLNPSRVEISAVRAQRKR